MFAKVLWHNRKQQNLPRLEYEKAMRDLKSIAWKSHDRLEKNGTRPVPVLTKDQMKCLNTLKKDKSILITRPDKGKGVVIMDKAQYTSSVEAIIGDESKYEKVNEDILKLNLKLEDKVNWLLRKLHKAGAITEDQLSRTRAKGTAPAILYALPKVHKEGAPLRPVLSGFRTHNYRLAKFMNTLLQPWTQNEYVINDTFEFLEDLSKVKAPTDGCMARFDIVSLYPSMPL